MAAGAGSASIPSWRPARSSPSRSSPIWGDREGGDIALASGAELLTGSDGDLAATWDGRGAVTTGSIVPSNTAIVTRALRKEYGTVVALEGLDVDIPNASVGLLGANGSGKSTLIKSLLGLIAPTSGSATVLGYDIVTDPLRLREHVGYMPESDCLPLDVTAADFVGHMAEMSGLPCAKPPGSGPTMCSTRSGSMRSATG